MSARCRVRTGLYAWVCKQMRPEILSQVFYALRSLFLFPFFSFQSSHLNELVKSHKLDGTVKSARCKARESLGMRRTYKYVRMTKDEAQRSRWTFYEAVNLGLARQAK